MKTHTEIGAKVLRGSEIPLINMACDIAMYHHERWDGTGYPVGLAGEDIPTSARITAICDIYDALVHDRVYRPALPEDTVLDMLEQQRGSHLDPQVLDCFLDILPRIRHIREKNQDLSVFQHGSTHPV